ATAPAAGPEAYTVVPADRSFTFAPSSAWIHTVQLTGLEPDTLYSVILDHPTNPDTFTFRTAPAERKEIVFLAGGDSRSNRATRRIINALAAAENPDFIIFDGDFIATPDSESQWNDWFDDWHEQLIHDGRRIPIIPAIGNHEVIGGWNKTKAEAPYYYNRFMLPDPGTHYALTYGPDLLIVTLDSDHTEQIENQTAWLTQTLHAHRRLPWKIVQYHHAAWPSVRDFNATVPVKIRTQWIPIFEQYDVDLVVEAHDHAYKLTERIRNGAVDPTGIVYTGDGGWGAPLRDVKDPANFWWLKEALKIDHFWKFTLSADARKLTVEVVFHGDPGENGKPFVLEKEGPPGTLLLVE
ncbi:MAG: metallophosphoesterase, partial [Kiritimatiellia bacterium]|nr:metallophosphoesterase [Kiritimatiellia bacterium]